MKRKENGSLVHACLLKLIFDRRALLANVKIDWEHFEVGEYPYNKKLI